MSDSTKTILRLALYARVSTEEQKEGQTIDSQLAELERFSREKGWPIVGTYRDEGWSGAMLARPELDRLRDDAGKAIFEAVLINDVDRLARDVAHLGVIKRDLERKGIQVVFRKLPVDASPTSNLMVNILGSFAEFERELIADRTRRGRRHKVEVKKQYLGSNTSYGYRWIPKDVVHSTEGRLEIVTDEAQVVKHMFEWVDQEGLSARRVVDRLNESNIPPKKGGLTWQKSSVLRILKNEMYAGTWHYNKFIGCEPVNPIPRAGYRKSKHSSLRQRPRSDWIPLSLPNSLHVVSRERWHRVQVQLTANLAFSPRNEKHQYLLKGLVRCGACGARYTGNPCHSSFYYRCLARCKKMPMITERRLNTAVQIAVADVMLHPDMILDPLRELESARSNKREAWQALAKDLEKETKSLKDEEQRILDAYRLAIISPAQLAQQLDQLAARKNKIEIRRAELNVDSSVPVQEAERAIGDYCTEAAKNLANFSEDEWRQFLRLVIQTITFHGDHISLQGRIPIVENPSSAKMDFTHDSCIDVRK